MCLTEIQDDSYPPTDSLHRQTVCSPNTRKIPMIPIGHHVVHGRADGKFYDDDFTLTPQHYHPDSPHLPFVAIMPTNPAERGLMWMSLSVESETIVRVDTGYRLQQRLAEEVLRDSKVLRSKCVGFRQQHLGDEGFTKMMWLSSSVCLLAVALRDAVYSVRNVKYIWAAWQRYYLETLAMYDYLSFCLLEIMRVTLVEPPPNHLYQYSVVGTIVKEPVMLGTFYALGVPVWYICPTIEVSRTTSDT